MPLYINEITVILFYHNRIFTASFYHNRIELSIDDLIYHKVSKRYDDILNIQMLYNTAFDPSRNFK